MSKDTTQGRIPEFYPFGFSTATDEIVETHTAKKTGDENVTSLKLGDPVVYTAAAGVTIGVVEKATAALFAKTCLLGFVVSIPKEGHMVEIGVSGHFIVRLDTAIFDSLVPGTALTCKGKAAGCCCCCGTILEKTKAIESDGTEADAYEVYKN